MPPLATSHSSTSSAKLRGSAALTSPLAPRTPSSHRLGTKHGKSGDGCARRGQPQLAHAGSIPARAESSAVPATASPCSAQKQLGRVVPDQRDASVQSPLTRLCRGAAAALASAVLLLSPAAPPAPFLAAPLAHAESASSSSSSGAAGTTTTNETYSGVAAYESAVRDRGGSGTGPNMSLFTEDARQAMSKLQQYAAYVRDEVCPREEACGEACTENREVLEKAWQVVASEHYSASGAFSQAGWATTLLDTLKAQPDGLIRTKQELQAAIAGMLSALDDPYTQYLPPSAFRRALRRPLPAEQSYLKAQYVGLGVELGPVAAEGGRVVLAPLAGSPAEAAGIARGDRLISIDGTRVDALGLEQARALMRGPAGSSATLEWVPAATATATATAVAGGATTTIATASTAAAAASSAVAATSVSFAAADAVGSSTSSGGGGSSGSGGSSRVVVMDVERRALPQPAIKVSRLQMGPPGFYATYVRLLYFGSETTTELAAALRRAEHDPANVGYVLDLRNNPGGVFEEALACASMFLGPGDVMAKTIRGPEEVVDTVWQVGSLPEEVFPSLPGRLAAKPVALLGNRSTASASEVFAGALRDNGRAPLVGEPTFGKGLVQYYFPLREGSDGGVRVTVAKYLTPSGYDISGRGAGLVPDRTCSDFPHGGLPTSVEGGDRCIQQAAALLRVRI